MTLPSLLIAALAVAPKADCEIFVLKDCPIANQYAPEIARIVERYRAKGVRFTLVYEDSDITDAQAKQHGADFHLKVPYLLDPEHALAKRLGVDTSPTAVVQSGKVVYLGRIDDTFAALGKRRGASTQHDLRVALDSILAGESAPTPRTQAVGCRLF